MSIIKDVMRIGAAAMGKDTDAPPESPRLFSEYMFIKSLQENIKIRKQKKLREKTKNKNKKE